MVLLYVSIAGRWFKETIHYAAAAAGAIVPRKLLSKGLP